VVYWAENAAVCWEDWIGPNPHANWADFAYYVGHGNTNGPYYGHHGQGPSGTESDNIINRNFHLGKDAAGNPTLRWVSWMACDTLYDGVRDSSTVRWTGTDSLERWYGAFQGLHSIQGFRSHGKVAWWYVFPWYIDDSSQRGTIYANLLNGGGSFGSSWFEANRRVISGFEAAQLAVDTEGTSYASETITRPYPDYVGAPHSFVYSTLRNGTPSW
jgi:hypothetical protein